MTDDQQPATPPPDAAVVPEPAPTTPALAVTGLGLAGEPDWVFRDVDLTVPPGALAAVVGPAGSGRSSLLLTLAGRMAPTTGTVAVLGHQLADRPATIRELTSVARIAGTVRPEAALTVRESVGERCLIDDVAEPEGRIRFDRACAALQFAPDPAAVVETVVGERATLLAVALAAVRTSAVILLDDIDRDVPTAARPGVLQALARLAATGPAIVVSAVEREAVAGVEHVVELGLPAGRATWHFDPTTPAPPAATEESAR